ncbi:MAG: N-acetyltransferase [Anaeroplasmataceae bacterium]|jgi:Predicted acetyltransferase|nr:N-acetyltransferase [Anaeroplasmataceae bacterium]
MEIIQTNHKVYIQNEAKEEIAYVTFPSLDEATVQIDHTYVDESLRGLRIASDLMAAAYQVIKQNKMKATLSCSYAKHWFDNHPECQDILK